MQTGSSTRSTESAEGGTTPGQFVFLILLVPVTVAMFAGPIAGAGLASLALFDSVMLLLGFDRY